MILDLPVKIFREVRSSLGLFLPRSKQEWIFFSFLFAFYLVLGLPIVLKSNLLDYSGMFFAPLDTHFAFDNNAYYRLGVQNLLSHPLIMLVGKPIVYAGNFLASILSDPKAKTLLILFATVYSVSMSCVVVKRFLNSIIGLKQGISSLITVMFANFFSCQVLSFTFESFTLSLFFLTVAVYYYSYLIKENRPGNLTSDFIITFALGGVTITNFAKGVLGIFFTKDDTKAKIKRIAILSVVFGVVCSVVYAYYLYDANNQNLDTVSGKYAKYSQIDSGFWGYILTTINTFFIAPILSFKIEVFDHPYLTMSRLSHSKIFDFSVDLLWRYLFAVVFYGLLILSIAKNYKNRIFQLLLSFFTIDLAIHIFVGFGITDGFFIYSGHWVFLYPLFLGFLYKSVSEMNQKRLFGIIALLSVILIANNLWAMTDFIRLAIEYFPLAK